MVNFTIVPGSNLLGIYGHHKASYKLELDLVLWDKDKEKAGTNPAFALSSELHILLPSCRK